MFPQRAFTIRYGGRVNVLKTEVGIFLPISKEEMEHATPHVHSCIAVWDTGANGTVVTKQVAEKLGLKPIGITEVFHAQGKGLTNEYLVNVALPNGVVVPGVRVTEGILAGCDVLIGMDIIAMGDFAVTNANSHGGTTLSFCIPSVVEIDFVPRSRESEIRRTGNREARRALKKKRR
ncbi:aspartyl protease family protein [Candidatus Kaiserbacteria bacterium]|nr:aspartyl protease family protein [Candidatus Kaiserbacteria bacterium]